MVSSRRDLHIKYGLFWHRKRKRKRKKRERGGGSNNRRKREQVKKSNRQGRERNGKRDRLTPSCVHFVMVVAGEVNHCMFVAMSSSQVQGFQV